MGEHNNPGNVNLALGNREAAIREFRLAVEADAQSGPALVNPGLALAAHGDAVEAVSRLRDAIRIDPGSRALLRKAGTSTNPKDQCCLY